MNHDFTRFTETDTGSQVTVTASTVTLVQTGAGDARVLRSLPAPYLRGDFSYNLATQLASANASACASVFFVSNQAASRTAHGTSSYDFLSVEWLNDAGTYRLRLAERNAAVLTTAQSGGLSLATPYYLTIRRDETVGTFGTLYASIYSDAARTTLVETVSLALTIRLDFVNLYALNTDTTTVTISCSVSDLKDNRGWIVGTPSPGARGDTYPAMIEVDTESRISVRGETITAALVGNLSAPYSPYLHTLKASSGNFSYNFDVKITAAQDSVGLVPWMVSDEAGSVNTLRLNAYRYEAVWCRRNAGDTASRYRFWLDEQDAVGAPVAVSTAATYVFGTTYYLTVRRDTSVGTYGTLYLDIYSNAARTTLVQTLSLALRENVNYSRLYGINQYHSGNGVTISGTVANLTNGAIATPEPIFTPHQSALQNHGKYLRGYFSRPITSYAGYQHFGSVLQEHGSPADVPVNAAAALADRSAFDSYYRDPIGWTWDLVAMHEIAQVAKYDLDLTAWWVGGEIFNYAPGVTTQHGITYDAISYVWISGRTGNTLKVKRGPRAAAFRIPDPVEKLSISVGAGDATATQLVAFELPVGDVGLLYAVGTTLYYRHWTKATDTWAAAETVATGIASADDFRGVVERGNVLCVQYRVGNDLRARRRPVAGAFGAEFTITTDLAGTGFYHTSCSDGGNVGRVYAFYFNGTDLVYRIVDAGAAGSAVVLAKGARPWSSWLTAPQSDSERIAVGYHDVSGGMFAAWVDLTAPAIYSGTAATSGTDSDPGNAGTPVVVTDWPVSLVLHRHRDGIGYVRLRDASTGEWMGGWTAFTKRYFDLNHDVVYPFLDSGGLLYFAEGGRGNGTPTIIKKTPARLNSYATSAAIYSALSDISPPNTGSYSSLASHRGYKFVEIGNDGVIYLLYQQGGADVSIMEYRSGAWSVPVKLVDLTGMTGAGSYLTGYCGGGETSPTQTSIHVHWGTKGPETPASSRGSNVLREINYARIVPQGAGTFKAYRADGVEMTLPMGQFRKDLVYTSEVGLVWAEWSDYALNDLVDAGNGHIYRCKIAGTKGGSPPTWPTAHLATVVDGGITWEEWGLRGDNFAHNLGGTDGARTAGLALTDGRPVVVAGTRLRADVEVQVDLRWYKWSGTAWTYVIIADNASEAFPAGDRSCLVGVSTYWFVSGLRIISGQTEVVVYRSADDGATWTRQPITTSSPAPNDWPIAYVRSANTVHVSWHMIPHRSYSEGLFQSVTLVEARYFWATIEEADGSRRSLPSAPIVVYH